MRFFLAFVLLLPPAAAFGGPASIGFADAAELAVAYSAELRYAYASQAIKERAWMLGLRAYFPRVSLNASENDRLQKIGQDSFVKNYALNVDQLLWDGGRTAMARKLERMELNLAYSQVGRMGAEIAESALAAYRGVLSSREVLAIQEASLRNLAEQRRILAHETAIGLALPVDLARADLTLAGAKLDLLSLQSDLAEMEIQFAELLGLETLPALAETVSVTRATLLPSVAAASACAEERNPDLAEARAAIVKRQAELQAASRSWIPTLRMSGGFGLSGQTYPLTKHNWSLGISVEFTSPWFQNTVGAQKGWEPPYDKTALLQNSFTPLPEPAKGLTKQQAALALALEREKYAAAFERIGRVARRAVEKCSAAEQKRRLAVEAASLAAERCRLEEIRLDLGQITRIDLMEVLVEYSQAEIAAVSAASALLETERELERLLDLKPGELAAFAAIYKE